MLYNDSIFYSIGAHQDCGAFDSQDHGTVLGSIGVVCAVHVTLNPDLPSLKAAREEMWQVSA